MKSIFGKLAVVAVALAVLPACERRAETLKADLGEVGYKLTPEDWFRASSGNDAAALKKFVAGGFSKETRNADGDTALHVAAAAGARSAADYLLNCGLAIDLRGASDRTPLMAAVLGDQTETVRWLLRQGADPRLKDKNGFRPLMLAVREGKAGPVGELAPYDRSELDPALLLAALVGRADVIDALTNFGASVYARMEDGRTPLMVAAENGHKEAVKLLLEIGASRFTTDPEGRTAVDLALAANQPEIAAMIAKDPGPTDLMLDSPAQIAASMEATIDAATAKADEPAGSGAGYKSTMLKFPRRLRSVSIAGETLSSPAVETRKGTAAIDDPTPFPMPRLAMRAYREKEVPLGIRTVQGDTATIGVVGRIRREVKVRSGEVIPGSNLVVLRVKRRMENSKVNLGKPSEISVVEVRDNSTGSQREWIAGIPAAGHDPVALVEDEATGQRYIASPGQRFKASNGTEYLIAEVRPNQMVVQEVASGAVRTIPLRGPRG